MIANEPDKQTVIPARLHAALVLATLGSEEFTAAAIVHADENLRRLCEVRQPIAVGIHLTDHSCWQGVSWHSQLISLSSPCCAVCWTFCKILNEDMEKPHVPALPPILAGCHSILLPVELPLWTPTRVIERMATQFRLYLREELDTMVRSARLAHATQFIRRRRQQSSNPTLQL
jgi:hypothetical protein